MGCSSWEETSLALAPGVPYDVLKQRLQQRLDQRGVEITEVIHEEFCLFPMNLPLPDRNQPVLAFGGAASMVHPASGYMVGSLLRRAWIWPRLWPQLSQSNLDSAALAQRGWQALWPRRTGAAPSVASVRSGPVDGLQRSVVAHPFRHVFLLPQEEWFGFLTNTLPLPRLMAVMLRLFALSSWELRRGLVLGAPSSQRPTSAQSSG